MKSIIIIFFTAVSLLCACNQSSEKTPVAPKIFEPEVSYTISRTGTNEIQEVESAFITAVFHHNVYPVLNNPGEKDIILSIYPELPSNVNLISRFGFEFLMSVPEDLLLIPDTNMLITAFLADPEDYAQLLLDNDPENGRRVCLTKEGQHPDGSILIDNACAGEGWYGEQGDFAFEFSHHELFYDDDNHPHIYAEGTFEAETSSIDGSGEKFKLSNGVFKLVIPLSLE